MGIRTEYLLVTDESKNQLGNQKEYIDNPVETGYSLNNVFYRGAITWNNNCIKSMAC